MENKKIKKRSSKAFTMVEFLVALTLLTLIGIALLNAVVYFLKLKIKHSLTISSVKVVKEISADPNRVDSCLDVDACQYFNGSTTSLNFDESLCDPTTNPCAVCLNIGNKRVLYGFNATKLRDNIYKITVCWNLYKNATKEFIVPIGD